MPQDRSRRKVPLPLPGHETLSVYPRFTPPPGTPFASPDGFPNKRTNPRKVIHSIFLLFYKTTSAVKGCFKLRYHSLATQPGSLAGMLATTDYNIGLVEAYLVGLLLSLSSFSIYISMENLEYHLPLQFQKKPAPHSITTNIQAITWESHNDISGFVMEGGRERGLPNLQSLKLTQEGDTSPQKRSQPHKKIKQLQNPSKHSITLQHSLCK